jgi:hypothetical protein
MDRNAGMASGHQPRSLRHLCVEQVSEAAELLWTWMWCLPLIIECLADGAGCDSLSSLDESLSVDGVDPECPGLADDGVPAVLDIVLGPVAEESDNGAPFWSVRLHEVEQQCIFAGASLRSVDIRRDICEPPLAALKLPPFGQLPRNRLPIARPELLDRRLQDLVLLSRKDGAVLFRFGHPESMTEVRREHHIPFDGICESNGTQKLQFAQLYLKKLVEPANIESISILMNQQ